MQKLYKETIPFCFASAVYFLKSEKSFLLMFWIMFTRFIFCLVYIKRNEKININSNFISCYSHVIVIICLSKLKKIHINCGSFRNSFIRIFYSFASCIISDRKTLFNRADNILLLIFFHIRFLCIRSYDKYIFCIKSSFEIYRDIAERFIPRIIRIYIFL